MGRDDGRAYCQGLNDGSFATDLAVIEDCEVMNSLWNFIVHKLNKRMNYWIGATDKDSEGTWQWLTGTHVQGDVPFWFPEQPDGSNMENCLTIAENGYFADGACNQEYGVICQAPVMTTFRNLE
ncbi:C-type lectin-like 15 [Homarus americanus]|uniref:C-type lectin-like 15 n=1 Tax=Homarus americanus TaxID=6706 RepID=A0A8J5MK52_HOMAM|nr:C-type lectin-like 15 [Homarus americanus]